MGLSHLDDFEYLKTMNEYPINKNMLYAIKGFKTIYKEHEPMFGFEQEFFMINPDTNMPYGFVNINSKNNSSSYLYDFFDNIFGVLIGLFNKYVPISGKQGPYYCGIGNQYAFNRHFLEDTLNKALIMGLSITGMNYEVAPGQAEFQVCDTGIEACNQLHMMRYLLTRNGEDFNVNISFKSQLLDTSDFNNSGCHTNFSTKKMRIKMNDKKTDSTINTNININVSNNEDTSDLLDNSINKKLLGLNYIMSVCNSFDKDICNDKIDFEYVFGKDNTKRLDGENETSEWYDFSVGIGTRDTSVRIPIGVALSGFGYLEDRRPGSNVCPYTIANWLMTQVVQHDIMINRYYYYQDTNYDSLSSCDDENSCDNNRSNSEDSNTNTACPCNDINTSKKRKISNKSDNYTCSSNSPGINSNFSKCIETNIDDFYVQNMNSIQNESIDNINTNSNLINQIESMQSIKNKKNDSTFPYTIASMIFGKSSNNINNCNKKNE